MDDKSVSRIIGDIIEINADILRENIESKYPKFIANIISRRQRSKLLKSITKFRNSNYILTIDNLTEFFVYIFDNFDGAYGCIQKIDLKSDSVKSTIDTKIAFDNYAIIINIETNNPKMNMSGCTINEHGNTLFSISESSLYSTKPNAKDMLPILNTRLKNDMSDYMYNIIDSYNKERGYVKK